MRRYSLLERITMSKLAKAEVVKVSVKKESKQKLEQFNQIDGLQVPPYDVEQLAKVYSYNGYHSRCIDLKATITAGLGYEIISESGNEPDEEYRRLEEFINNHPVYAGRPFIETLIAFQTDWEAAGNGYLEIARNNKGEVAEIYHIPQRECRIIYRDQKVSLAQIVGGTKIFFSPFGVQIEGQNEFLQMKNYNPESRFYGRPEWIGALQDIVLDKNAAEFNISKFMNNAIPECVIDLKGAALGDAAKGAVKEFFSNNFKGIKNAGRALIIEHEETDSELKVIPVAMESKEGSFRFLRTDARDAIIAAHGVPKRLIGIAEPGSLGGSSEGKSQMKVFTDCVIEPRQNRLEFILNEFIVKRGLGITKWKIKLNELYVEDPRSDASFFDTMIKDGVLSSAEVREELGYDPVDTKAPDASAAGQQVVKSLVQLRKALESAVH